VLIDSAGMNNFPMILRLEELVPKLARGVRATVGVGTRSLILGNDDRNSVLNHRDSVARGIALANQIPIQAMDDPRRLRTRQIAIDQH